MLDVSEIYKANKSYHWVLGLLEHDTHPLKDIILDYEPDGRSFFQTAYLYLGEVPRAKNKTKKVCVVHFHSSLKGPMKFMNMQNLQSYECMYDLRESDVLYLAQDITRETVIKLDTADALTPWHLDLINNSDYFYITDETGFTKSYETLYYRG